MFHLPGDGKTEQIINNYLDDIPSTDAARRCVKKDAGLLLLYSGLLFSARLKQKNFHTLDFWSFLMVFNDEVSCAKIDFLGWLNAFGIAFSWSL